MSFHQLGLSAKLLRAVDAQGYKHPTPVQSLAIPPILFGDDLMARAQTGTGKTAGFTLPLLQRLNESPRQAHQKRHVRALILTPTRELAAQVHQSVRTYGSTCLCPPPSSSAASAFVRRPRRSGAASMCSCPPRVDYSITSSSGRWTSPASRFSFSMKRTGCSTWAFFPTSAGFSRRCLLRARTFCSRRLIAKFASLPTVF